MKILGLDPGTLKMGYGVLNCDSNQVSYVNSGTIILNKKDSLGERLFKLGHKIDELFISENPDHVILEKVFFGKNPDSAFKLGLAFGVGYYKAIERKIKTFEYSTRTVKKAVTGSGSADKIQARTFVQNILSLKEITSLDESDALALALCHAYNQQGASALSQMQTSVN